jgi:hypothetical protein
MKDEIDNLRLQRKWKWERIVKSRPSSMALDELLVMGETQRGGRLKEKERRRARSGWVASL